MKVKCFSTHSFEERYLTKWAQTYKLDIDFLSTSLNKDVVSLAKGYDCISCWPSDDLGKEVLKLTTINQPGFDMGKQSFKLLYKEIKASKKNNPLVPKTVVLDTDLIIRETTSSTR